MKKLLLILCLLYAYWVQAQNTSLYELDSNRQVHDLKAFTYVLVDSLKQFPDSLIINGQADDRFFLFAGLKTAKLSNRQYWLRLSVKAVSPMQGWWLLLRNPEGFGGYTSQNDYADVWYVAGEKLLAKERTGVMVPRSQKKIQRGVAGFNAVSFSVPSNEVVTIYIKVTNEFLLNDALSFPVIQHPVIPAFTKEPGNSFNILIACAIIFCILSFFFFFFIREKSYLFFGLYTFILSQHYLILHPDLPFINLYIPEHPHLVVGFWRLLTMGSFILFSLFGRSFMNLRVLSPKTDKWFRVFLMVWAGMLIIDSASLMILQKQVFPDFLAYSCFAVMLIFIIRFAFSKSVLAKLYVGGALWLLIFTVFGILDNTRVIAMPFNPWPIAQLGQLLIYAAALAYKVRLNEKARAEALRIREMDEIKSKFFANISHELRTPLTLIQGPLQQIEEQVKATGKNEAATVPLRQVLTMRRNTDRLLELVNQLLDLSRLDSGKMKLQVIKGDVLQLLKTLAASFESMAERKQIHYHIHFPEQTHIAFFDKDKLEKIFGNLLGNAFKYTPEKGTVSVIVEMEDSRLRLSVEDNGPGIAKKELDKVFDRFYQVEGTEDKGTGIGLALVKELVDLYRGQISVSSEPGKGSRFRVSLPIDKPAFNENELVYGEWRPGENFISRTVDEKEETISNQSLAGLPLLLVVEDNNDLRQFICETVQQHYQLIEAKNGKEGFEIAMAEIPDIIISDVTMTEKIKKDEKTSHIPVILLTAKAGQQHKIEGLETGADDYLTKPFDAKELLARIQNLVNQRKLLRKKFAGSIQLKPSEVAVKSIDELFLTNVMQAIEKNMEEEDFGVEELSRKVAMSRSQLHRKLIALIDRSPSDLIRQTRLLRAKELLQKKASTPSEVAFKVGFSSHTYFSKCFKEEFGVSPSEINV
jgi:signal transduction histidine kinase/DNA-binding response OmpR family regulator